MREAVLAAMQRVSSAQTSTDRAAALAALLLLLDTELAAVNGWSGTSTVSSAVPVTTNLNTQKLDSGGQIDIPLVAAAFLQSSCFVTKLEITNQGLQDVTVSVWDANGDFLIPPRVVPKGEITTYSAVPDGRRMVGGIWWQASAVGCKAYVRWQPAF